MLVTPNCRNTIEASQGLNLFWLWNNYILLRIWGNQSKLRLCILTFLVRVCIFTTKKCNVHSEERTVSSRQRDISRFVDKIAGTSMFLDRDVFMVWRRSNLISKKISLYCNHTCIFSIIIIIINCPWTDANCCLLRCFLQ